MRFVRGDKRPDSKRKSRFVVICRAFQYQGRAQGHTHARRGKDAMLSEAERNQAADILMKAEKKRKQAVQLTKTFPNIVIEDSYAISALVANRKIAAGAKLIGHKVGLTSK